MTDSETLAQWNLRGITFRQAVREGTHAPDGPRQGTLGAQHTEPGGLDHPTWKLPFKYAMVVPPFIGAEVVKASGLGNPKGFIDVKDTYQTVAHPNVYAVGIAAAVNAPWTTANAVGVPMVGSSPRICEAMFSAATWAMVSARNPV